MRLGQFAKVVNRGRDNQVVRGRKLRSFGRVYQFCLEGDQCAWRVRGGGFVAVALNSLEDTVIAMSTNARGWRTPENVGRGSTVGEVRAAYPDVRRRTRCVAPAGARVTGLLLRDAGADTLFSLHPDRAVVDRVHVVERAYRCR